MNQNPPIESLILTIRGMRVILSPDLASLYGVETRALIQAIKRNPNCFPADFTFQLAPEEFAELRSQGIVSGDGRACLRSQDVILDGSPSVLEPAGSRRGKHSKYPPYAFTEHGAIMAANVMNSPQAVAMSVFVVRAFVQMREHLIVNTAILKRLAEIDKTLLEHDQVLSVLWQKLKPLLEPPPEPPKRQIGFNKETSQ